MSTSTSQQTGAFDEDAALTELSSILPAADRLRFAALGRVELLSTAKQKSLSRAETALVARQGPDAPQVRNVRNRLEIEKRFDVAVAVEKQRTQATTVTRNPEALTLHGRVVNIKRLGVPGLTVSAIDAEGKAVVFCASDTNGYFSLVVPAGEVTAGQFVTLLVSDREQAVYYRGTECFAREPGKVHYREIVTGITPPSKPPTPPPEVESKVVTVPDVLGLRQEAATTRLRTLGLQVEASTMDSTADNVGLVLAQDPEAGAEVAPCSTIKIVVGAPQPAVQVPNVVGLTLQEAKVTIEESGLGQGTVQPENASPAAKVVQQSPAAGTSVPPQTPVNLIVREDAPPVTVPNVVQSTLAAARKIFEEAGLKKVSVEPPDSSDDGLVVAQDPEAGAQVQPETAIVLKVQPSLPTVKVPDLSRLTLDQARAKLEAEKLKLGNVTTQPATDNQVGLVLSQTPKATTQVAPGSEVALVIGANQSGSLRQPQTAAETIQLAAREPDFGKIGATEAKLLRIAEEEGIATAEDLAKSPNLRRTPPSATASDCAT